PPGEARAAVARGLPPGARRRAAGGGEPGPGRSGDGAVLAACPQEPRLFYNRGSPVVAASAQKGPRALNISVIGLGKLGSPMAAVLADKGHTVLGVDVNEGFVKAIQEGRGPVRETGLDELVARNRARLSATTDYAQAVLATEMTFVIVPTPSKADGTFSIDHILAACRAIGQALTRQTSFLVVVSSSTSTSSPPRRTSRRCPG